MDRAEIQSAIQLKNAARVHREAGRLDSALKDILAATTGLEETLKSANDRGDDASSPTYRELIGALAESYGVQGGIYRSLGDAKEAYEAYDRGYDFERHPARTKENSYNLVQRLMSRIFSDPSSYGRPTWVFEDLDMWNELSSAHAEVERQIDTGGRWGDQWAAADAIFLSILLVPKLGAEVGGRQVMEAFERFEDLEYDPFVCASTIRAFAELEKKITDTAPNDGAEGRALTVRHLQMAITRIKEFSERSGR
jgi:tetratricopeptide (TPR) repeat protein